MKKSSKNETPLEAFRRIQKEGYTTITIPFTVGQQVWAMRGNKTQHFLITGYEIVDRSGEMSGGSSTRLILRTIPNHVQTTIDAEEVFPTKEALLASL